MRKQNQKHLKFIATLPCVTCGKHGRTQAAHIRAGNMAGMGLKSPSDCTVPLCVECHSEQHKVGEINFWCKWGGVATATALANLLYKNSGNREVCIFKCVQFKNRSK